MKKLLLVPILCLIAYAAYAITVPFTITVGSDHVFTPLHQYYMAPAGNGGSDSNAGTFASPWLTADHAGLVCGDVIIARSGAYPAFTISNNPTGCPSSSAGIDGTGGIYVVAVVCAGSSVGDCTISGNTGVTGSCASTRSGSIFIAANNWAITGFQNTTGTANAYAFGTGSVNTGQLTHHVAFINNISTASGVGFGAADCSTNQNVPGDGPDQWAAVGNIAYNSALLSGGICSAGIVDVGPANANADAGTHVYIAGNVAYTNRESCVSDIQGIMWDTPDAHGYTGKLVIKDNIIYNNSRYGIHLFYQGINSNAQSVFLYQNTMWGNFSGPDIDAGSNGGELNTQSAAGGNVAPPWTGSFTKNIAQGRFAHYANNAGGGNIYAMALGFIGAGSITIGGTGSENVFKGLASTCPSTCDGGNNVESYGPALGTNFYIDPVFKSTSDLVTNHFGAPNCSGFSNVTACIGWNQGAQTITALSVIDDLTPTAGSAIGKGYQVPKACAADTDYPTWLKGVVYLQASGFVNGATITEKAGLISKPCTM